MKPGRAPRRARPGRSGQRSRHGQREIPLRFNDDFRGAFTYTIIPIAMLWFLLLQPGGGDRIALVTTVCAATVLTSIAYLAWTHLLFTRADPTEAARIARAQHLKPRGFASRFLGFGNDAGSVALSMAGVTLVVAITAIMFSSKEQGTWLPLLVLGTAAVSWATMVYSFALQYFRLYCGGERITFDIEEDPEFTDFLSMSVMVSSVGAMSAGTPRTRAALRAVRTHTYIAFIFNALVVAMTVSILGSLISSFSVG